jgi:hypothetical protein
MYTLTGGQVGAPAEGRDTKSAAAAGNQLAGGGGERTAGNYFAEAPSCVQRRRTSRISRAAGPPRGQGEHGTGMPVSFVVGLVYVFPFVLGLVYICSRAILTLALFHIYSFAPGPSVSCLKLRHGKPSARGVRGGGLGFRRAAGRGMEEKRLCLLPL